MPDGLVLNIQRFSIHDGPGIRTTVFLKGCPARCWWCHNPESQSPGPELVVIGERCIRCGACLLVCPSGAARAGARGAPGAGGSGPDGAGGDSPGDPGGAAGGSGPAVPPVCTVCGACVDACPPGARSVAGTLMTVDQVLEELLRDRIFYEESGGGITLSGGEPLLQFPFAEALLRACRRQGLHTALDTCGSCPREHLLAAAAVSDLVLYDIKVLDEDRHREATGVDAAPILQNLKALGDVHDNIWIRIPVIPGLNDDPGSMEAIARFVGGLRGIRQVNLLPYHRLGVQKAGRLGRTARVPEAAPPTGERLEALAGCFRSRGCPSRIGG